MSPICILFCDGVFQKQQQTRIPFHESLWHELLLIWVVIAESLLGGTRLFVWLAHEPRPGDTYSLYVRKCRKASWNPVSTRFVFSRELSSPGVWEESSCERWAQCDSFRWRTRSCPYFCDTSQFIHLAEWKQDRLSYPVLQNWKCYQRYPFHSWNFITNAN
jgi:hypothetical protein